MTKYATIASVVICSIALHSEPAHGALRKGYLRLGFDSTFLRFGLANYNPAESSDTTITAITAGAAMPNTGVVFGYSVLGGLVLGARLNVGIAGSDQYFAEDHFVSWSVYPYLEYVFLKEIVRPFLTVQIGAEGLVHYQADDTWWWGFNFGGGFGIHFFLHQNVSIDVALMPGFTIGTGEMASPGQAQVTEFKHWRFTVAIPVGVSGWF